MIILSVMFLYLRICLIMETVFFDCSSLPLIFSIFNITISHGLIISELPCDIGDIENKKSLVKRSVLSVTDDGNGSA